MQIETVRRYQPIEYDEMPGDMVTAADYVELLSTLSAIQRELAAAKAELEKFHGVAIASANLWKLEVEKAESELSTTQRERDELKAKLERLPADWEKDSSLATWFPITAEAELATLKARESAEDAWNRGFTAAWSELSSAKCCEIPSCIAPTAEEESK